MAWGSNGDEPQSPWGKPQGAKKPTPRKPEPGKPRIPNAEFEELLRKSQERLKRVVGGPGTPGNAKPILLMAVLGIFALWLASGIYIVKPDEQGVVTRFGAFERTTAPGIGYHFPSPIEDVQTPKVTTVNRVEIGYRSGGRGRDNSTPEESLMLTGDENIVDINFEVQWKISDAPAYLFNVREPEATVKAVAESAMREVIGRTPIKTVLAEGKLQVEQQAKKLVQETLSSYQAGIEVVSVNLLKADPPAQVIDAFRDMQTAKADSETARNQAEAYRNDILPRARGEAQKLVLDAEAYQQEVVSRARGEASRFASVFAEYRQSKDVTKKRMYLETMEDILPGMSKLVVDKQSGGVLPYLPLDSLKAKPEGAKP